jgi:SAM-dependent methyltransferase
MPNRAAWRDSFHREVGRLAPMADQTTSVEPLASDADTPEYGAFYYRHDCGIPYERNEHWLGFFSEVADSIVRNLHPTSVLDAGCAMGFLVEALRKRDVEAWGIDVSEYAIARVDESVREYCSVASLTEPLARRYDLIACIEVLEHVPPSETDRAIANLCGATDNLLFSSTPHDYGEATHLNVQPPEFWSAALAREGFLRVIDYDTSLLAPWTALYSRTEESLVETVRRYDRSWWRLRHEVAEVRAALLATQEQLAELEASPIEDRPQLMKEIDSREEEILKLRDLLVGKDAELGAARGQLDVVEASSGRLVAAAGQVQARIPRLTRLGGAVLRRLQRRRG